MALLKDVHGASDKDISLWMIAPIEPIAVQRKSAQIRCKLLKSEILARRDAGVTAIDIANEAGVRISRIYQILKEQPSIKLENLANRNKPHDHTTP